LGTMRFVFRADCSHETGAGHVMRLSAIAEEAIDRGIECVFIGDLTGVPWLQTRIQNLGFAKIVHSDLAISGQTKESVLFIDSYSITANADFVQKKNWLMVIAIVDPETPNYEADIYVHPGLDDSWIDGSTTELLYGPDYIPFRKSITRNEREISNTIEKIVVFGGGTDPTNFSLSMAKVLAKMNGYSEAVFLTNFPQEIQALDNRFRAEQFGSALDENLLNANLVLTSSSTSSLEVIARGIPVGIACLVDNQATSYKILGSFQLALQIGTNDSMNSDFLNKIEIQRLIKDSSLRSALIENSKNMFDLRGSFRIINKVLETLQKI